MGCESRQVCHGNSLWVVTDWALIKDVAADGGCRIAYIVCDRCGFGGRCVCADLTRLYVHSYNLLLEHNFARGHCVVIRSRNLASYSESVFSNELQIRSRRKSESCILYVVGHKRR